MPVTMALQSADAHTRQEATRSVQSLVATLQEITEKKQRVDATMALLLRETRAARRRRRRRIVAAIVIVLVLIGLLVALDIKFYSFWWILQIGGGAWAADQAVNARRDAARALGEAGEPRAVGVLAVALRDGDTLVQHVAENALLKLLPSVRASDAAFIGPDEMNALLAIAHHSNLHMKLALLKALEQIGDARAIPVVERLQKDAWQVVREQATECLPFLQERVRQSQQRATLLRAASAQEASTTPDQLLRAASAVTPLQTPPGQLLRPVEPSAETQSVQQSQLS